LTSAAASTLPPGDARPEFLQAGQRAAVAVHRDEDLGLRRQVGRVDDVAGQAVDQRVLLRRLEPVLAVDHRIAALACSVTTIGW
jgi:hypothetical protein